MNIILLSIFLVLACIPNMATSAEKNKGYYNIPFPTAGGTQVWADQLFFHKWRIQQNVFTKHHRLLDASNIRHAWGSYDACVVKLQQIKKTKKLKPMKGKAVVLMHGLVRTRNSMRKLAKHFEKNGYVVVNVSYPTTRYKIAKHAQNLSKVLDSLSGIEEINFVGHSLGNLVVRHYMADQQKQGKKLDTRINRFVMLAPPNNGSKLASRLKNLTLMKIFWGIPGQEIGGDWKNLNKHLATPPCQFGIIAGGNKKANGRNPLLKGDDDIVVSVEETKLAGAHDFKVMQATHSFIMDNNEVAKHCLQFFQHGYFVSEAKRSPLK